MRAVRIEELHERPELLQVVRTRFARTFFCAGFIRNGCAVADRDLSFTEMLLEPLKAHDTCVIAVGFTLALAGALMTFLIQPGRKCWLGAKRNTQATSCWRGPVRAVYRDSVPTRKPADGGLIEVRKLPGPM